MNRFCVSSRKLAEKKLYVFFFCLFDRTFLDVSYPEIDSTKILVGK